MTDAFLVSLQKLSGQSVNMVENIDGVTVISFSNKDKISCTYWRLIGPHHERLSSFDDGQKYGLLEKINATEKLSDAIFGGIVSEVFFDKISGDLEIVLSKELRVQVFNFSGNEVWEIEFSDGTGQISNYV